MINTIPEEPSRATVLSEGAMYHYRFTPELSSSSVKLLTEKLYDRIAKPQNVPYGFLAKATTARSSNGDSHPGTDSYILEIPNTVPAEQVERIFAELNATGLVSLSISNERYPRDQRPVIELSRGEKVVARIQANAKHEIVRAGIAVLAEDGIEREFYPVDPVSANPAQAMANVQNTIAARFNVKHRAA